jgi:hypothetical protein
MFTKADVISAYTRAQALADGVLIDVTKTAREAGIRFPVAVTAAVWNLYVQVPEGVEGQDEAGRLWDLLWMLRFAVKSSQEPGDTIRYNLLVRNDNRQPRPVTLKAVCGPDDDLSPCITVMLLDES